MLILFKLNKTNIIRIIISAILTLVLFFYVSNINAQTKSQFQAVEMATPKIVCMNTKRSISGSASAGIIYHKQGEEVYMITAAHVVNGCSHTLYMRHKKRYRRSGNYRDIEKHWFYKVDVVAYDTDLDLAVIKTRKKISYKFPVLKISKTLSYTGQPIYISGYPGPFARYLLTEGIISSDIKRKNGNKYPRYLITDGDLYFGNSGGPAVNKKMEIVGVVSALASGSAKIGTIQGPVRGMLIASDTIWQFFRENAELHQLYFKLHGYPKNFNPKVK